MPKQDARYCFGTETLSDSAPADVKMVVAEIVKISRQVIWSVAVRGERPAIGRGTIGLLIPILDSEDLEESDDLGGFPCPADDTAQMTVGAEAICGSSYTELKW